MRILPLLVLLLPAPALAQSLPELFSVVDVASGDSLNIRTAPDATAAVIGMIDRKATGIEVVEFSDDGRWALINAGEGSGWVSRRYIEPQPSVWSPAALPSSLRCFGTEPFWGVDFNAGMITLSTPDAADQSHKIENISDRGFIEDRIRLVQAGPVTAVIFPQQCSDGMSERSFGLQAVLSLKDGPRPMLAGCCSIAP